MLNIKFIIVFNTLNINFLIVHDIIEIDLSPYLSTFNTLLHFI